MPARSSGESHTQLSASEATVCPVCGISAAWRNCMTANLHKHRATSQQDARLPATPRENIDDHKEVQPDKSDAPLDSGLVREEDGAKPSSAKG